jgi:hypothetical protein
MQLIGGEAGGICHEAFHGSHHERVVGKFDRFRAGERQG